MPINPTPEKAVTVAYLAWNLAVGSICSLFGHELFQNRIEASPLVKIVSLAVFIGLVLQSLANLRRGAGALFR
jgi:hypothetical protein